MHHFVRKGVDCARPTELICYVRSTDNPTYTAFFLYKTEEFYNCYQRNDIGPYNKTVSMLCYFARKYISQFLRVYIVGLLGYGNTMIKECWRPCNSVFIVALFRAKVIKRKGWVKLQYISITKVHIRLMTYQCINTWSWIVTCHFIKNMTNKYENIE